MPVGDGLTGYAGGSFTRGIRNNMELRQQANGLKIQADAMLELAETNAEAGVLPEGVIQSQYKAAQQFFDQSEAISSKISGKFNEHNYKCETCPVHVFEAYSNDV